MEVLVFVLFVLSFVKAREYSDEELSSFPKLFHLDDYDRCLAKQHGLYCVGVFDLMPDVEPNPLYELLKEYSDESHRHFNRTRIHRGYCVSSRCPQQSARNATQRFENCADELAQARNLRVSINKFHHCHTHADKYEVRPRTYAQEIFLQCIYAIFVINIIGTIYDVYTGDQQNKNKLLTAFSIPANWRRLTVINEDGDPRLTALTPVNGVRVVAMLCTIYGHANVMQYAYYIINPETFETQVERFDGIILSDGTSLIQAFVLISCFFTGYNLLIYSQKYALSLTLLPLCIIKRLIRLTPVSLFVVGYAATWWIHSRDGPLVDSTIGLESRACQSKFWSHVFYVNNIVDSDEYCVMPTWFLSVDMHMCILASTLTLLLWRRRRSAIKLYAILFVVSCVLIGVIAYIKDYKSMIILATPENIRSMFRDQPSFTEFYISSWGALPACFLGLLMAHIQYELDLKSIKLSEYKWFVYLHYITHPLAYVWALTGMFVRNYSSPLVYAIYAAFDRPLFCVLIVISLFGLIHINSPMRKFYAWKGWTKMSRVALTIMLLHWCVLTTIATRPVTYNTSILDVVVDWLATTSITYILAIPITLLLEIPMQKFLSSLIF